MSSIQSNKHRGALGQAPTGDDESPLTLRFPTPRRILAYGNAARGLRGLGLAQMELVTAVAEGLGWQDGGLIAVGPSRCHDAILAMAPDEKEIQQWVLDIEEELLDRIPGSDQAARIRRWKLGPRVGLSAMTLCCFLEGIEVTDPSAPRDLSDFNRCLLMLEYTTLDITNAPENLPQPWPALLRCWDELTEHIRHERFDEGHAQLRAALTTGAAPG